MRPLCGNNISACSIFKGITLAINKIKIHELWDRNTSSPLHRPARNKYELKLYIQETFSEQSNFSMLSCISSHLGCTERAALPQLPRLWCITRVFQWFYPQACFRPRHTHTETRKHRNAQAHQRWKMCVRVCVKEGTQMINVRKMWCERMKSQPGIREKGDNRCRLSVASSNQISCFHDSHQWRLQLDLFFSSLFVWGKFVFPHVIWHRFTVDLRVGQKWTWC